MIWLCGEGSGLAAGVYVMAFSLSQPGGGHTRRPATGRTRDGRGFFKAANVHYGYASSDSMFLYYDANACGAETGRW